MIVIKFGGTSVSNALRISGVADIVLSLKKKNEKIAVVVSAFGGVTDDLIRMSRLAANRNDRPSRCRGHAASGICHRRWLANAATARDFSYRQNSDFDGAISDYYSRRALVFESQIDVCLKRSS